MSQENVEIARRNYELFRETWATGYRDRAKALEAVGLSEQDAPTDS